MDKIVFLILHYKVLDETIKCVESILDNYKNEYYDIVIVDNGSNNGTGKILKDKYNNFSNIHIIINEENLGFAKGNNVGFKYAKDIGAKYIVMANNDIIFLQEDFCRLIKEEYEKYDYAVLGPKVTLPIGDDVCYKAKIRTLKQQILFLVLLYVRLFLAYIHLERIFEFFFLQKNKKRKNVTDVNKMKENVPVYGCCMIFSKNYIEIFDGIDDRTFLYCEEDLLYLRLLKYNLKIIYDPVLEILHNHSVSTNSINKSKRNKEIFVVKNLIKSNKILLNELKESNNLFGERNMDGKIK